MPNWLATSEVPLFVSRRRLSSRKGLPVASCDWALDSGGFSELSMFGEWRTTAAEYAAEATRFRAEVGRLAWAAPQDWMCEPVVRAKTGRVVEEHQERTIDSVIELRSLAPSVPWVPVLQGWRVSDYFAHVDRYAARGLDLTREPVVGVGSVCRRQHTEEIAVLMSRLHSLGLRVHGFGLKTDAVARWAHAQATAD
jgi:hypothetical protein